MACDVMCGTVLCCVVFGTHGICCVSFACVGCCVYFVCLSVVSNPFAHVCIFRAVSAQYVMYDMYVVYVVVRLVDWHVREYANIDLFLCVYVST